MLILLSHQYLSRLKQNVSHIPTEIKMKLCLHLSEASSSGHHFCAAGLAGSPAPYPLSCHANIYTRVSLRSKVPPVLKLCP